MTMRLASPGDLETIAALTAAAYRPYTELFGAPPIPVTEDYGPRIQRGEVWLREAGGEAAGLVVVERDRDHLMLFSIAVSPAFQGAGHGLAMLNWRARHWSGHSRRSDFIRTRLWNGTSLYSAFGFQETGRRPNPYRPGWVLVDMTKEIVAA
ncbi:GNAT family N-acetyltransferase [Rhizobium bangladeshense]|uniref:GNAT family N-acetyltransferase n=1 Tax=Rhizobium bangladeshense TaxID=1138189 RepID=UPI000B234852|nr:GNAT family N-acetyltransferase [Rhizobium bangladeshense]